MQCNLAIYLTLVLSAVCASVVCPEGMWWGAHRWGVCRAGCRRTRPGPTRRSESRAAPTPGQSGSAAGWPARCSHSATAGTRDGRKHLIYIFISCSWLCYKLEQT